MVNRPLGYNINIKTLDEQFGVASKPPAERTEDIVVTTGEALPTEEAKAKVMEGSGSSIYDIFVRGYQANKTAEQLQAEVADQGVKQDEFNSNPEFVAEQALTVNDFEYSAIDTRITTNLQVAQEMTQERIRSIAEEKTGFGSALDTVDRFVRAVSPIGTYEDITGDTEETSRIILDNAAKMSPKDFKVWFTGYMEEVAQEGIFRSNTVEAFQELSAEISSGGYDPNKGFNQVLAGVDIATSATAGLLLKGARTAIKTPLTSTTAVGRVAAIKGPEAASKAADDILKTTPDPVVLGNVAPSVLDAAPQPVRPSQAVFTQKIAENKIAQEIDDLFQKGAFGRVATQDQIKEASVKVAESYRKNVSTPVYDFRTYDEGLGNYVSSVRFGKAIDGTPFKPRADGTPSRAAQEFLKDIQTRVDNAVLAPVDPNDLKKGYVVEVKERLNLSGMPEALDETQDMLRQEGFIGAVGQAVRDVVGLVMNNSVMGSTALRDVQRLNTLSNMAESSRAAVKKSFEPYTQKIGSLSAKERYTVQAVYTQLRDGKDAALRVRYTEGEFHNEYRRMHPNGAAPSKKAYEAYEALAQVEETDYLLKTHNILQRYVEKGFKTSIQVRDNYFAPAKRVSRSEIPADARILDGTNGGKIRVVDIESDDFPIWKLDKPTADGQEYVVTPKATRMIEPTDVMGYNPGGSRVNPQLNYFVVIGDKRLKALMGAFSEKQAKTARDQLNNIKKAFEGQAVPVSSVDKGSINIPNGISDWASALQFQKIGSSEPPLKPNHFRLYRGEGGTFMGSVKGGRWFTLDLSKAEKYADNGGEVVYLDIDIANRADLLKLTQGHGGVDELLIDDAALRASAKPLKFKTNTKNTSDLDEIIQANNDWNPGITTADEFIKFANDEGWDLTRGNIAIKGRDDDILDAEVDGEGVFVGLKADDYVQNDMRRNNKVLLDFGGGRAYNEDPVNSILSQVGQSVFTYSNRAYARNAMVGWVKKAQQRNRSWFPAGVSPNNYEELFRRAEITGSDEFSRRMAELRDITMRKMNMQDDFSLAMERTGQVLAEHVFDKTGLKLNLPDPSNILLKIGFQSAFGFFNVAQFFMQGFHATTIMAISPKFGFKGAGLVPSMRAALRAYDKGAGQEAITRFAKAAQITDKEAEEWFEFVRTSGRAVIEGDAIEDGTGVAFGVSGWKGEDMSYGKLSSLSYNLSKGLGKTLEAGLLPFKQGERLTRLTAMNTAILEFKAKFPKVSVLSDQARMWITRREQDLTFNMSSQSRGWIQADWRKVPTQWLSYTMRAMEAVLVGRNFTVGERTRLFTMLVPFFGTTGFGLTSAGDYIAEKVGAEPGGSLYMTIKYGLLDALLEMIPGDADVAVGSRLAPVGAIVDTWKNITEGKFLEVAGGPSGQIFGGLYDAVTRGMSDLFLGQSATLTEDVIKILRTPSGVDNIAKAMGIFNNGIYRSKTGISLDYEMTVGDGIIALTGFTPLEAVEHYSRLDSIFTSDKKLADFRKQVDRDAEYIFQLMANGTPEDTQKAIQLMEELHVRISFSGFSQTQMMSLRRSAATKAEKNWLKIQRSLIAQENLYGLQAYNALTVGSNE